MNKSNDIFIEAAHTWNELTSYQYNITYGYKATLRKVNITFSPRHFPHLAGFQYLKDITLPQYPAKQIVTKILEGKIKYTSIIKSMYFEELVKPRLEALILLKNILDNDFSLFSYTPQLYPFRTSIKADFLISSYINSVNFIFIIKSTEVIQQRQNYLCCSAFTKGDRDYEANQRKRTLLKKERIHLPTNTSVVLFDKLNVNQKLLDKNIFVSQISQLLKCIR